MIEATKAIQSYESLKRSLDVTVKISHEEVDRLVLNRLIGIRNSVVNRNQDLSHIDKTIRFFLSEDEFNYYVINKVPL